MRCWGPEANVGVRKETPANWGLKGRDADKRDEDGAFVVKTSVMVKDVFDAEGISKSPPPQVSRIAALDGKGLEGGRRQCHWRKSR